MSGTVIFVIGFCVGGIFGVFVMCLLVMARDTDQAIERIKKGGKG